MRRTDGVWVRDGGGGGAGGCTLSFDAGYAMFQSDSALFSRLAGTSVLTHQLGRVGLVPAGAGRH